MQVVYQNQLIEESQVQLKISNRGFLYGDGFFETILYLNKQLPYLKNHCERIFRGLDAYELAQPDYFNLAYLEETIHQLCQRNKLDSARIKILIWRSEGGFYAPENKGFEFLICCSALHLTPEVKDHVMVYPDNINVATTTSEFKPLSASKYVSAGLFKQKNALDDVIILGQNDVVSEALYSNVFWIKNHHIFTPSLKTGCIGGVMRNVVLSSEKSIIEVIDHKSVLYSADSIFLSNALGIQHITQLDGVNYKKSDFAQHLIENLIRKYV